MPPASTKITLGSGFSILASDQFYFRAILTIPTGRATAFWKCVLYDKYNAPHLRMRKLARDFPSRGIFHRRNQGTEVGLSRVFPLKDSSALICSPAVTGNSVSNSPELPGIVTE